MKFLNLLSSFLFTFCMISCTSQSSFDLIEVRMPFETSKLVMDNFDIKEVESKFNGLKCYKSVDSKLLVFDKLHLEHDNSIKLDFFLDETSDLIKCFYLETSVEDDSKKMYAISLDKLGEPDYYNKDENFFNGIWELDNTFIILKQNFTSIVDETNTTKSKLIIFQNDDQSLIDHYMFEGLNNYNDFLKVRAEKKDSNYSYKQFAEDKKNDFFGEEKYARELLNNLPL